MDGLIAAAVVDLLRCSGCFTAEEAQEYIEIGVLNGLFVLGRTVGFIGELQNSVAHNIVPVYIRIELLVQNNSICNVT